MNSRTLSTLIASTLAATGLAVLPAGTANAASSYRVSVSSSEKMVDVSSKTGSLRRTTISGRVSGGPVKGRTVRITATNTTNGKTHKTYKVKLGSSGTFSKRFEPPRGGVWKMTAAIGADGRTKGARKSVKFDAFHWTFLHELYEDSGALNKPAKTSGVTHRSGKSAQWFVRGQRYNASAFLIKGGNSAVIDVRGYQCKKISFKVGVEDRSTASRGSFKFYQPAKGKKDRVIKAATMKRKQKAYDAMNSHAVRNRLIPTRPLHIRAYNPNKGNLRVLVGNAKVFCTFPSIN
jgi:hypothetical protein